jgi:hypothetical protein
MVYSGTFGGDFLECYDLKNPNIPFLSIYFFENATFYALNKLTNIR